MTKSDLPRLLRSIRDRFSSTRAMAAAIGISASRVGRAMKGEDTLNELNCLRLAKATGTSATTILRAAGKADVADLIEELYGDGAAAIDPTARRTLAQLHSLPPPQRERFLALLAALAVAPRARRRLR